MQDKDKQIEALEEQCRRQTEALVRAEDELRQYKQQIENSTIVSTKTMELVDDPLYLEKIVALMPGLIYWHDRNGVVLGCNNEEARVLGFSSRYELIGKTPYDVFPKEVADRLIKNNDLILNQGKPHILEEEIVILNGEERSYLSQKVPLKNIEGDIIGFLGISLDITERKKIEKQLIEAMEQAQAADRAKTEFLANMSHDIRTPFVGIIGIAEHLFNTEKEAERKEHLGFLLSSSRQLLSLLNDVLEFSHVESGVVEMKKEKVDFRELIEQVNLLIKPQLKENTHYSCFLANDVPELICIERSRLQRILLNLLSNAAKFTEKGHISLKVNWIKEEDSLEIQVQDTGVGIPKPYHTYVFEKFSRIQASDKQTKYQGSGLGLYVVKRFVEELRGTLSLESKEGKGSCFTIRVPVKKEVKENYLVKIDANSRKNAPHQRNVLLVEDNPIAQLVTVQILKEFSCNVDLAGSIGTARECLQKNKYDIVFLDLGLPDGRGDALVDLIHEKQVNSHIIVLTASNESAVQAKNIDIYVSKPLERETCSKIFKKLELIEKLEN